MSHISLSCVGEAIEDRDTESKEEEGVGWLVG